MGFDNKYAEVVCENGHTVYVLKSNIKRNKTFRCYQCLWEKRTKEAENVGIELLSATERKDYGKYKLSCGCILNLKYCHVKDNNFKCKICQERNQKEKEKSFGLIEIERVDGTHSLYLRESCGHTFEMNRSQLSNFCWVCKKEKHEYEAHDAGLEIVAPSIRGNLYREYRFKDCGHIQTIAVSRVRENDFSCRMCQDIKIQKEASEQGLIVIGKSPSSNKNRLYLADCGHELDLAVGNVRVGSWTCHVCNDTYYSKPNNIYLLEIKTTDSNLSFLKLGYSKNIEFRIKSYGLLNCNAKILFFVGVSTGEIANKLEKALHKRYKDYALNPDMVSEYITVSGFTECYPMTLKNELLLELENIKELNNG